MSYESPYAGVPADKWLDKTRELVGGHPLQAGTLVEVVLASWSAIFDSRLGGKFRIGTEITPKPQIMGFLLHELIPLELQSRYPDAWRPEREKRDKDLVFIPDQSKSIELKTSSHASQIFGNRSYAQEQVADSKAKDKNGYYLAVNFQKFVAGRRPSITSIRFGWLDHTDWVGQAAATGQNARLLPTSERGKLLPIYRSE